jgi:hypothetical protein
MNKEMRKPEVKSIDEAIEQGFEFHMWQCTKSKNCREQRVKEGVCNEDCGIDKRYVFVFVRD